MPQHPLDVLVVRHQVVVGHRPAVALVEPGAIGEVLRREAGHGSRPVVRQPAERQARVPLDLGIRRRVLATLRSTRQPLRRTIVCPPARTMNPRGARTPASSIVTRTPRCTSRAAAVAPHGPLPTTTTDLVSHGVHASASRRAMASPTASSTLGSSGGASISSHVAVEVRRRGRARRGSWRDRRRSDRTKPIASSIDADPASRRSSAGAVDESAASGVGQRRRIGRRSPVRTPPPRPRGPTPRRRVAGQREHVDRRFWVEHAERQLRRPRPARSVAHAAASLDVFGADAEPADLAGVTQVLSSAMQPRDRLAGAVQLVDVDVIGLQPAQARVDRASAGRSGRSPGPRTRRLRRAGRPSLELPARERPCRDAPAAAPGGAGPTAPSRCARRKTYPPLRRQHHLVTTVRRARPSTRSLVPLP